MKSLYIAPGTGQIGRLADVWDHYQLFHAGEFLGDSGDSLDGVMVFPVVKVTVRGNKILGAIWPNRSKTPFVPKSGEQEDQMAPILVAASIATTA